MNDKISGSSINTPSINKSKHIIGLKAFLRLLSELKSYLKGVM